MEIDSLCLCPRRADWAVEGVPDPYSYVAEAPINILGSSLPSAHSGRAFSPYFVLGSLPPLGHLPGLLAGLGESVCVHACTRLRPSCVFGVGDKLL